MRLGARDTSPAAKVRHHRQTFLVLKIHAKVAYLRIATLSESRIIQYNEAGFWVPGVRGRSWEETCALRTRRGWDASSHKPLTSSRGSFLSVRKACPSCNFLLAASVPVTASSVLLAPSPRSYWKTPALRHHLPHTTARSPGGPAPWVSRSLQQSSSAPGREWS